MFRQVHLEIDGIFHTCLDSPGNVGTTLLSSVGCATTHHISIAYSSWAHSYLLQAKACLFIIDISPRLHFANMCCKGLLSCWIAAKCYVTHYPRLRCVSLFSCLKILQIRNIEKNERNIFLRERHIPLMALVWKGLLKKISLNWFSQLNVTAQTSQPCNM